MSNFICPECGTACIDTPSGYVTGCEHYPMDLMSDTFVHPHRVLKDQEVDLFAYSQK